MNEYIITENQLKTAMEACLKREIPLPITNVFISGDKLPEVVRCRDCKHARIMRPLDWKTGKPSTVIEEWYCEWHSNAEGASDIDPDGFCSWGERRGA